MIPNPRRRALIGLALALGAAYVVVGCTNQHTIQVDNASSTQMRVLITLPGGGVSSVSPLPGTSASVVVSQSGSFAAVAVPDPDWLEAARFRRDFLSSQLADRGRRARLTASELRQISEQVNGLADEIRRATDRPMPDVAGCSGDVQLAESGGVAATVQITDNPTGSSPAYLLVC